ncbi:carbohydrate kinase family protein [Candidatus Woesearchaeota archaeon]|nr:carbohydrate kinase family protein [Candidatus Woesearchaeota archaeon]
MYDVITVGSATMDVFADTESELISITTLHSKESMIAYPLGSKILIEKLKFDIGGGGTNSAVCFSKLGLAVAYAGALGNDANGNEVIRRLHREQVDFIGQRVSTPTNYSVILDSIESDRTILVFKGASKKMSGLKLSEPYPKWVYASALMGKSLSTLLRLARTFKKKNIKFAFNPSNYVISNEKSAVKKLAGLAHVISLNSEEAKLLVEKTDIKSQLHALHRLGSAVSVITMGAKGAAAFDGKEYYCMAPRKGLKIRETTGAGDAFGSTFVFALIKGYFVKKALHMAMLNAESVISRVGAKNGLMTFEELTRAYEKDNGRKRYCKLD